MPDGPYAKLRASLTKHRKQNCPQIPTQPRPTTTTTTTKKAPATTPSTNSGTVDLHIYQPPPSRRGWANNRDLKAPLRYLGLLDVARLKLPTGVPRPRLVSQLISSYDRDKGCGYISGTRVNVDHKSLLSAVSLHPTPKRGRDLPPNVPLSAVTRAAKQFISMCLRVQSRGDVLPILSAAIQEVEAGSAQKVDWGKLMWDLVENEILELPKRDDKVSYFGVYLQRLIWVQQPTVFHFYQMSDDIKVTGARPSLVGMRPMEVQSSQLGAMLNDGSDLDSDDDILSSTPDVGKMHIGGHKDHAEAQHRFQQGNQQKRAPKDKNCGVVLTGSAIAIANSSHDIAEIERELKNATSDELREAETLIQVVKLLQEELSPEAIMHMFD